MFCLSTYNKLLLRKKIYNFKFSNKKYSFFHKTCFYANNKFKNYVLYNKEKDNIWEKSKLTALIANHFYIRKASI